MTNPTPFIYQSRDGSWHINGGLVFCKQFAYSESSMFGGSHSQNSASNVCVISFLPRWYQLRRWWNLLQLLRRYTTDANAAAVELAASPCDILAVEQKNRPPATYEPTSSPH